MNMGFADTPRIKGKPFSKRVGNNLLERDKKRHVCCCFGYYNSNQTLTRKIWVARVKRSVK